MMGLSEIKLENKKVMQELKDNDVQSGTDILVYLYLKDTLKLKDIAFDNISSTTTNFVSAVNKYNVKFTFAVIDIHESILLGIVKINDLNTLNEYIFEDESSFDINNEPNSCEERFNQDFKTSISFFNMVFNKKNNLYNEIARYLYKLPYNYKAKFEVKEDNRYKLIINSEDFLLELSRKEFRIIFKGKPQLFEPEKNLIYSLNLENMVSKYDSIYSIFLNEVYPYLYFILSIMGLENLHKKNPNLDTILDRFKENNAVKIVDFTYNYYSDFAILDIYFKFQIKDLEVAKNTSSGFYLNIKHVDTEIKDNLGLDYRESIFRIYPYILNNSNYEESYYFSNNEELDNFLK